MESKVKNEIKKSLESRLKEAIFTKAEKEQEIRFINQLLERL